jgi:glycosyltransferase involved in cell wall biosynthesis
VSLISTGKKQIRNLQRQTERQLLVASAKTKTRNNSKKPILLGATNSAGQANSWAMALRKSGRAAQSLQIVSDENNSWFNADRTINRTQWKPLEFRKQLFKEITSQNSGVLLESLRPIFALNQPSLFTAEEGLNDLIDLWRSGLKVAAVFHGSDIRDQLHHAKMDEFSPYRNPADPAKFEAVRLRADHTRLVARRLNRHRIKQFVTTPDLIHELPDATWLPAVIDIEKFKTTTEIKNSTGPLKVLFLPSNGWLKSENLVVPVLNQLEKEGVIKLVAKGSVSNDQMPALIESADVVIDRFDGIIGVASIEAMAAKRLVIANVAPWIYDNAEVVPPVIHATPKTLADKLHEIAKDNFEYQLITDAGFEYVNKWHDGKESAARLNHWL